MTNQRTGVSIAELHEQIKQIQQEIEGRKASTRANLRGEIEQRLREVELTIFDIFPELKKTGRQQTAVSKVRADVQAKYKDPASGDTWSVACHYIWLNQYFWGYYSRNLFGVFKH